MIREILWKELLGHLRSLRLSLAFALVVSVMAATGFLFVGEYGELVEEYGRHRRENAQRLEDASKSSRGLVRITSHSQHLQRLYSAPNPLGFLAGGSSRNLPNSFDVGAFRIEGPKDRKRANAMLERFADADWAFVIGVLMSFVALILTYDGIAGEKEDGTLRMIVSNAIPRSQILLGKYFGAMIALCAPLILGMLVNLIVIVNSGLVPLRSEEWLKISAVAMLSFLYLSVFVLIGLFVSSRARRSSTSLVVLLLFWAVFVVIFPSSGGIIASQLRKPPPVREIAGKTSAAVREVTLEQRPMNLMWGPPDPLSAGIDVGRAWNAGLAFYRNAMIRQVRLARRITRISPFATYQYACEGIAGTGLPHFERFYAQVRRYKEILLDVVREEDDREGRDPGVYKLDLATFPKFEERLSSPVEALGDALGDMILLFLFGTVFFLAAYVSFLKCDVR